MELIEVMKDLISNVGFPIACVAVMFYQSEKEREAHKAESEKWVEALNNNTNVMQKIVDKLGIE